MTNEQEFEKWWYEYINQPKNKQLSVFKPYNSHETAYLAGCEMERERCLEVLYDAPCLFWESTVEFKEKVIEQIRGEK